MEKLFAFTDESGAFGYKFEQQNVSSYFVIACVLVKENQIEQLKEQVEIIRKKYFQAGEIKSSHMKPEKRKRIFVDVTNPELQYKVFALVFDKKKIAENSPLWKFKTSFYKFINNLVHQTLKSLFSDLTIVADEFGSTGYMQSFHKYFNEHNKSKTPLFDTERSAFQWSNSKTNVLIQLADLYAGTIRQYYENLTDVTKASVPNDTWGMLAKNLLPIEEFPRNWEKFNVNSDPLTKEYDKDVAETCYRLATNFLRDYSKSEQNERKQQYLVLNYLTYRFINNNRRYIKVKELQDYLSYMGYTSITRRQFHSNIIAPMRDAGVIISSTSKGYKIPSFKSDLENYFNHETSIALPILKRLKLCCNQLKLGTLGKVDLIDQYKELLTNEKLLDYFK